MPEEVVWIMVIMVSLVVGFLIGWLLEYYLDLKYWEIRSQKRGGLGTKDENTTPATTLSTVAQPSLANEKLAATLREFLAKSENTVSTLRQEMEEQKARYDALEQQFEQYMATHPDDLTAIRGIGRIYQWKLRDGGISSYAQLANTTPERIREILDVPAWRKFEPEAWIEQGKALADRGK
ncbi:MAG: hypothetical protein B6I35_12960 [Anaerolineaceae bacterium 4572_32.2]|nr:MAG: hypothetical protein B6I35_12960 [Anaerolineaceae bacterium 4572_32.2]